MPLDPDLTEFTTASPILASYDYFDFATGLGYKKYYMAGLADSVGNKFILTDDDGLLADLDNYRVGANGTDVDFDITFNNTISIAAANATISYTIKTEAAAAITMAWTIYHVRGGSETSLGTITDSTTTAGGLAYYRKSMKVALTAKDFQIGDILRVNVIVTSNVALGTAFMWIDPAGALSAADTLGRTVNTSANINIPFKLQQ